MKPVALIQELPKPSEPGAFATKRRHDIHTGIDLYCNAEEPVYALEDGVVVAIEAFTGAHADSPWWNNTWALLIEGASGVVVYGEIEHLQFRPGTAIAAGSLIGHVIPVLKKDKGVTPTSMLHLELHKPGTTRTSWWHTGDSQPDSLLDPTNLIEQIYAK